MNNVISALCGTVNFMPPWIMLGVFGAIILLTVLIIALRGAKWKFFRVLIYILVGLIPFLYLVYLVVQIALWDDIFEIIAFVITWLPTVIFVFFVVVGLLRGMRRGLRKSLILTLHAAGAGVVCIAFFFTMVYVKEVDAGYLKFINFLMGGDGALQNALGVPESCSTFKQVLSEIIPVLLGGDAGLGPIIKDNTAYIYTLVDLVYRINFGVLAFSLFFSLDFILYLVYVFCYSEHKYKRIQKYKFINGKTDRSYKKHWLGGGVVGLVRGVLTGLLCMSFIGSIFFVVAGGKGDSKLNEDYDFGNNELNGYYKVYRSIEEYGSEGILKILNAITDSSDTPYYLFAADLMLSGELNDEELGISENIKFREEFAAFTGFAHDTAQLLMRYGFDEIKAMIGGDAADSTFDTVVQIMAKPGFKEEFDCLIDAFDAQTYIINLSMSLVNSIVSNIDIVGEIIGDGEKELIKLIFRKGFLTANIPDERELMDTTGKTEAEGEDIRPYLTVNHLLTKKDVKVVLNLVLSMLAGEETGDTLQLVERVTNELSKLSILSTERKDEFNPVLARMYCLFENLYLTADGVDGVKYSEIMQEGIDWIGEINRLLDAVTDTLTLYNNLASGGTEEGEESGALAMLKNLFDEDSDNYQENMAAYDNVCTLLIDSRVMGRALSTNFVYRTVKEALMGLAPNIYIPEDLQFNNTYGDDGEVVSYGETYQLLYGVKLLLSGDNAGVLNSLLNAGEEASIESILEQLAEVIKKPDEKGNTLATYLTESKILRSVISIELIEVGGNTFYVPNAARERVNGEFVNLITKEELKGLLENMTTLVDFVNPFVGDSTEWESEIDNFLIKNDDFYKLVKTNRIFEGTVARLFNAKLTNNSTIVVPNALNTKLNPENIDGWITVDGKQGELLNLLDALRNTGFNVSEIIRGGDEFNSSSVLETVSEMNGDELEQFFSSSVLHYTVSKYILSGVTVGGDFVLVVPVNSCQTLKEDVISRLVKKSELISVFGEISKLGLYDEEEVGVTKILVKIIKTPSLLEGSLIIPASIVATIVNNDDIADKLSIPEKYDKGHMGAMAELEQFDSTNPWTDELPALLDALDEVLGLREEDEDYEFTSDDLSDKISGLITKLNDKSSVYPEKTKLNVLYDSEIFRKKITEKVDDALIENEIVDNAVITYVKLNGDYKFDELQSLSNAVNILEISSFEDLSGYEDFKDKIEDNLDEVYESYIIRGIITKQVQKAIDENEKFKLYDHPMAYNKYVPVYNKSEISSIFAVTGSLEEGEVDLGKVSGYLYDEEGATQSYIMVASVSEQLIDNEGLVIPSTVVETVSGKQYIKPLELSRVVKAFNVLKEDLGIKDFSDFTDETKITIPEASVRSTVFESEIMRARITYQLIVLNSKNNGVLAVSEGNGDKILDVRETQKWNVGETSIVNAAQLDALANSLSILYGEEDTEFKVPVINSADQILDNSDKIEELLKSDIVRYRICEYLINAGRGHVTLDTEDAFNLVEHKIVSGVYTATAEQIITAAELIKKST